jgi:hypothetical protein
MSDGGAIVNDINVTDVYTNANFKVKVVVSHDSVEISNLSFNRKDLLLALDANPGDVE